MKVKELIRNALNLNDNESVTIEGQAGGMTNLNYFVTVGSDQYVVRLAGYGTEELVNRKTEKANLNFATNLGINPKLIYFNEKTGMKITEKVNQAITLTPNLAKDVDWMPAIANVFKTVHYSGKRLVNEFKLFDLMEHYWKITKEVNPLIVEKWDILNHEIIKLSKRYQLLEEIPSVPCHIDPTFANFLISGKNKVYLIDWEYSGMFDPLWDLSSFMLESRFTEKEEKEFLNYYFNRTVTKEEAERILMYKIFQDYLWSLWSVYKEAKGDNFGSYGIFRLKRAHKNIQLYHSIYSQIEAG